MLQKTLYLKYSLEVGKQTNNSTGQLSTNALMRTLPWMR